MNDIAGNYIRLIDTADSVDRISEITNRAAWDVSITNQEYCEIYNYAVNKVRDKEVNENEWKRFKRLSSLCGDGKGRKKTGV